MRHPNILKYVSSWRSGREITLVTEQCRPLQLCLKTQNAIQICLGLRSVLQALCFVVEQAQMRHLNVCSASIYVTNEGAWKLSGFEFLCQANELHKEVLQMSHKHRCKKSVDPKRELETGGQNLEQFAFAVLCKEIFKFTAQAGTPFLDDFQRYCDDRVTGAAPADRPTLSDMFGHAYFNQEFIKIHEFMSEISLKSSYERQEFFTDLIKRLKSFDERDVAVHLGDLLLSRLVLLDETAQTCVTPFVLDPKCGKCDYSDHYHLSLYSTINCIQTRWCPASSRRLSSRS